MPRPSRHPKKTAPVHVRMAAARRRQSRRIAVASAVVAVLVAIWLALDDTKLEPPPPPPEKEMSVVLVPPPAELEAPAATDPVDEVPAPDEVADVELPTAQKTEPLARMTPRPAHRAPARARQVAPPYEAPVAEDALPPPAPPPPMPPAPPIVTAGPPGPPPLHASNAVASTRPPAPPPLKASNAVAKPRKATPAKKIVPISTARKKPVARRRPRPRIVRPVADKQYIIGSGSGELEEITAQPAE